VKLIDAAVRLAAYTRDERVLALKRRLVEETIKAQKPDGYVGQLAAPHWMWSLWDIHEMGYIIYGLTADYHYFQENPSLGASRKAADFIFGCWSKMSADWSRQTQERLFLCARFEYCRAR